jgi:hypothetical protein
MKNCQGDASKLREKIDNIVEHYQDKHSKCHETSRCRTDPNYEPSKFIITSEAAKVSLLECLHKHKIYKKAEEYCKCRDTHYVESFNNALLQYHDKRIVFGPETYKLRMDLAIIDWNEHVDRPLTSRRYLTEISAPRRQLGPPVHTAKTYHFWTILWKKWMEMLYN